MKDKDARLSINGLKGKILSQQLKLDQKTDQIKDLERSFARLEQKFHSSANQSYESRIMKLEDRMRIMEELWT